MGASGGFAAVGIVPPPDVVLVPAPSSARPRWSSRFLGFLKAHPVLCLLILTPGIPEYLSSSSSLTLLFVAPWLFFAFLLANLALYGPGVLLIREAMLRWRRGWMTLVLLGSAYAVLEEGVALATIFNPAKDAVGHLWGINWLWTPGVLMVHVVFSIGLPIVLLALALPETQGRSLIGRRGLFVLGGILAVDVALLMWLTVAWVGFWIGVPLLLGSLTVIAALLVVAYFLPAAWETLRPGPPSWSPARFAVLGALVVPLTFLLPPIAMALGLPFAGAVAVLAGVYLALLLLVVRHLGSEERSGHLVALATGLLVPLAALGFIASLPVPVVILVDAALAVFLARLWERYQPRPHGAAGPLPWGAGGPRLEPNP